ncbi:MAG: hypothetical protein IJD69_03905 [Alphaproteobacteria bacterium]|nr:hypothetical protein [Alphaproteobacteria bacterium]
MSGLNVKQSINQNLLTFIFSMLLIVIGECVWVNCVAYYALAYSVALASAVSVCSTVVAYTINYCTKKHSK